ncbi:MAG: indole-3-glycerol phosphate synthase TrpC [Holosporales bacterium]
MTTIPDVLLSICRDVREVVARQKAGESLAALEALHPAVLPRGFSKALHARAATGRLAVIAETKRQSPSAGTLRPAYEPVARAEGYAAAGADAISVLTEEAAFGGSLKDLRAVRGGCPLPLLRKDFMIDPYQVAQARAYGADAILIIMAAVSDILARELFEAAKAYQLDVLVEVHDAAELERAALLGATLIGINNRNLRTLKTDLATTAQLAGLVPSGAFLISESGLKTTEDLAAVHRAGARGILIGEHLLRQPDPGAALQDLLT